MERKQTNVLTNMHGTLAVLLALCLPRPSTVFNPFAVNAGSVNTYANSLDPDETPSNSASHQHPNCQSCIPNDNNVASMQSCYNCRWPNDCPNEAVAFTDKYYGGWAKNRCENVVGVCGETMWDSVVNTANMQYHATCVRYIVEYGYVVYRETCHTDCPTFKVFEYEEATATCPASVTHSVTEDGDCLAKCLDTIGCRGASLSGTTCQLHTCDTHTSGTGSTFYKRTCIEDCASPVIQVCYNCGTDESTCPYHFSETTSAHVSTCNVECLSYPECQTSTYVSPSTCLYYDCDQLELSSSGTTAFKKVCHTDCIAYSIDRRSGETATCVLGSDDYTTLSENECLANCLEMPGCRGVAFSESSHTCLYSDCTTSVADSNYVFIARICIFVSTYTQVCKNCKPTPSCNASLTATATTEDVATAGTCNDTCISDTACKMAFFDPVNRKCTYHTCTEIQQAEYNTMVYRTTENPECLEYEIFVIEGYRATCSNTLTVHSGISDVSECIIACADMTGCVGITHSISQCSFYNCTSMTPSAGDIFVKKVCVEASTCSKDYVHTCLNCHRGYFCQGYIQAFINLSTIESCKEQLLQSDTANIAVYNGTHGICGISECSKIRQRPYDSMVTVRKTCSQVCNTFRIFTVDGHEGACAEFATDLGGVSEDYCVERCLDMDNCVGVSYNNNEAWCKYHDCLDSQQNSNFTFIRRECMDTSVVKNYTQTCWNCDTQCMIPKQSQTSVMSSQDCSITCTDCVNAKFDPLNNQCDYYECDLALIPDVGAVIKRKTSNSDCLEYEMFAFTTRQPNCTSMEEKTGLKDIDECIKDCLDMPGCRAVYYISGVCAFYNCTSSIPGTSGLWIVKSCIDGCTLTMQTCYNCEIGPECPATMGTLVTTEAVCINECDSNTKCQSVRYATGTQQCSIYSCGEVTQDYQVQVYRKSCDSDCPLYEVYVWDSQRGSCGSMMTEYFIAKPYLCLERCLDMNGCRGVSYSSSSYTCTYHTCDCSVASESTDTFLWRYCLASEADVSVISDLTAPSTFPKASSCTSTTVASTPPTAANTTLSAAYTTPTQPPAIPVLTTTASSTSQGPTPGLTTTFPTIVSTTSFIPIGSTSSVTPATSSTSTGSVVPEAIYLTPCFCSSGAYTNKTNEEIIADIVETLTVDPKNTSATRRKLTCAEDDRPSSQWIGAVGSLCIAASTVLVTGADIVTVVRTVINIIKHGSSPKSTPDINTSTDTPD